MKSERETLEKLSAISDVKMSSQKQQDIWNNIEKEIDHMNPVRMKRRSNFIGTSAAAVAAVAIVAGGFYAFSNHSTTPIVNHNLTTATQQKFAVPSASQITSISIIGNKAVSQEWVTYDPKSVVSQVVSWLNSATPYTGKIPKSDPIGTVNGSVGPVQLKMTASNGQNITIVPATYTVTQQGGKFQVEYVQNIVVYKTGNNSVYLTSPQLYTWLTKNQWATEFTPKTNPMENIPYTAKQLANMPAQELANYNKQHNQPLPFASNDITREIPKQPLLVSNPKSGSMFPQTIHVTVITDSTNHGVPNIQYNANQFQVIDHWAGTLNGKPFEIEVDKKTGGSTYLVGIANGPRETAYSFSKQPYITNFTGSYMVFATPNPAQENPFYAINLQTGALNTAQAYEMSNDYGTVGGASGNIEGLSQPYSSLPFS
ncbi:hypothetical protein LLE49_07415 [Alicyclobacillus tolerans]|uniref:hypothetical protein n=1 Tax=Alicyclobacillus tolerans TaxID=90970 RepID=UPI001F3CD2F8|nr:hypothetical protein [Alicyclobacillus tolerans]MCF8564572.1 hypothetical protein [Alicyclobacillus tolerans]